MATVALAAAMLAASPAAAQEFPGFDAPVVDAAEVVPANVEVRLNRELQAYRDSSGNQIAIALVDTLDGRPIEDFSIDLAREWGVGQDDQDNGVLLLIAVDDRELRIEVGRGLEGQLTDLESGDIIDDHLVPRLQAGDYGGAIEVGADEIRRALGDTSVGEAPLPVVPEAEEQPGSGSPVVPLLAAGFVLLSFLGGIGGRRRRRRWGIGAPIIWGGGFGGGRGRMGGGGFGGGGFGGGGGGGFSGGGASGGW